MNRRLPATRRRFLLGSAALTCTALEGVVPLARAHNTAGQVTPPELPPELALVFDDGAAGTLRATLRGRVSALQLMFTSCQATCPIQGALFADAAKRLGDRLARAQLLSVSIDPNHDTPAELRKWLARFGPSPRWRAARPDPAQLPKLEAFLKSRTQAPDPHTGQAYFFNLEGKLVLRSVDFPPATEIIRVLERIVGAS